MNTNSEVQKFDERGRRWAETMLRRLRDHWLEVPLLWPGTLDQALTIVHAFSDDSLEDVQRQHLADIVQSGARAAWHELQSGSALMAASP
jgi:hypothetical protein